VSTMKVEKIRIQNLISIVDSGEVSIDEKITTLIGKNEQGKTSYLKALESFNKKYFYKEDDLCHFINNKNIKNEDIPMVTIWLTLNEDDKNIYGEIYEELSKIKRLKITKYFDNHYHIEIEEPHINLEELNNVISVDEQIELIKYEAKILSEHINSAELLVEEDKQKQIHFIASLQNADGGFSHIPSQPSHMIYTYCAVNALEELEALDIIDKNAIINFIQSTEHPNGGFGHLRGQQPQVQFTHNAICILKKLNATSKIDCARHLEFIKSSQNSDGGFGHLPGQPSHVIYTYYAIRTLKEMNGLEEVNNNKIIEFILSTQHPNGGFGHLPGQPPQMQFLHNAIFILKELNALDKIDYNKHINYIISSQHSDGGFGNIDEALSHMAHTFYAVKALKELDKLEKEKIDGIILFILSTKHPNGGFGHLPGQQPQVQFTYNAILILKEFEKFAISKYNHVVENLMSADLTKTSEVENVFNDLNETLEYFPMDILIKEEIKKSHIDLLTTKNILLNAIENDIKFKILEKLPIFIYFDSNINLLHDNIMIGEYLKNKEKYKTFTNLFLLAGLEINGINNKHFYQRRRDTDRASTTITGLVNESWLQEKVQVNIGIDGENIFISIQDEVGAHVPPSKRSDGFQWYLSFYINFMADTKRELRNAILLLDNSGLLLHPSGQKDLLKIFSVLSEDNQIVFTTHSPYLIDRTKLNGIRIVRKEKEIGSILLEKFHDSDFDSLEPIRSAFGIAIGDSLFGSKENIIVEGFSDYQILEGLAYYFKRRGYESIDISKTSIISVGGADKVPYYALLVWKEGYDFVTVLDNDNEGRKVANELKDKFPLDENQIIKLDKVVPEDMRGIDIAMEDLIDPPFYNCAVNRAYKELIKEKLGKEEINIDELDNSVTMQDKRYSKYFWENKKLGGFDKILVAKEIRNILTDKSIDDDTLGENTINNFKKLFTTINERFE